MKVTFIILAGTDVLLLGTTAVLGFLVQGEAHFFQHFLLGLLTGLYTCLLHVIALTYFVVSQNVVRQASAAGRIDPSVGQQIQRGKSVVLRWGAVGVMSLFLTIVLGAIVTEPGYAASWGVRPIVHLLAAGVALVANLAAFVSHAGTIDRAGRIFAGAFPASGATSEWIGGE